MRSIKFFCILLFWILLSLDGFVQAAQNLSTSGRRVTSISKMLHKSTVANIWAISKNRDILFRTGITSAEPNGISWEKVNGLLKHIAVTSNGHVWGIDMDNKVLFREGITEDLPEGTSWSKVDGTFSNIIAKYKVIAIDAKDSRFIREGITEENQKGTHWRKLEEDIIVEITPKKEVVTKKPLPAKKVTKPSVKKTTAKEITPPAPEQKLPVVEKPSIVQPTTTPSEKFKSQNLRKGPVRTPTFLEESEPDIPYNKAK